MRQNKSLLQIKYLIAGSTRVRPRWKQNGSPGLPFVLCILISSNDLFYTYQFFERFSITNTSEFEKAAIPIVSPG